MRDTLTVKGLGRLDGVYEFDRDDLLGAMTNRELHRIKVMAGVRAGEIQDALAAGDNDVLVALAAIILTQRGKQVDDDLLWDAPAGAGLVWKFEESEADADPPAIPAETPETEQPNTNGGESGNPPSAPSGNGQSLTGLPVSVTSATSAPATSAT